jgi:large-conductance mechanosensitive channel
MPTASFSTRGLGFIHWFMNPGNPNIVPLAPFRISARARAGAMHIGLFINAVVEFLIVVLTRTIGVERIERLKKQELRLAPLQLHQQKEDFC